MTAFIGVGTIRLLLPWVRIPVRPLFLHFSSLKPASFFFIVDLEPQLLPRMTTASLDKAARHHHVSSCLPIAELYSRIDRSSEGEKVVFQQLWSRGCHENCQKCKKGKGIAKGMRGEVGLKEGESREEEVKAAGFASSTAYLRKRCPPRDEMTLRMLSSSHRYLCRFSGS